MTLNRNRLLGGAQRFPGAQAPVQGSGGTAVSGGYGGAERLLMCGRK
jgi:hypothetical protein